MRLDWMLFDDWAFDLPVYACQWAKILHHHQTHFCFFSRSLMIYKRPLIVLSIFSFFVRLWLSNKPQVFVLGCFLDDLRQSFDHENRSLILNLIVNFEWADLNNIILFKILGGIVLNQVVYVHKTQDGMFAVADIELKICLDGIWLLLLLSLWKTYYLHNKSWAYRRPICHLFDRAFRQDRAILFDCSWVDCRLWFFIVWFLLWDILLLGLCLDRLIHISVKTRATFLTKLSFKPRKLLGKTILAGDLFQALIIDLQFDHFGGDFFFLAKIVSLRHF